MSSLHEERIAIEQLRREAGVNRMFVSQAVEDLKKYIWEHEQEDCLLMGFHNQKANPFREKNSCLIL